MPSPEQGLGAEQPQQQPAADSAQGTGLQPGGLTPDVAQAISALPQEQQAVVTKAIKETKGWATRQSQTLSKHVERSNFLQKLEGIPDVKEMLVAVKDGNLPDFYLRKSPSASGVAKEQPQGGGFEPVPETGEGTASDPVAAVKQELQATRQELGQVQQQMSTAAANAEADAFMAQNPDWQKWYPHLQAVKGEPGKEGLSLQDAMHIAKAREALHPASEELAAGEPAAQSAGAPAMEEGALQPPLATGAVGTTDGHRQPRDIFEAAEIAAKEHGHRLPDFTM